VDQRDGLGSMVVLLGVSKSLRLAKWLHIGMLLSLAFFGWAERFGFPYAIALGLISWMLMYWHLMVGRSIEAANWALSNAVVGLLLTAGIFADLYWKSNSHS